MDYAVPAREEVAKTDDARQLWTATSGIGSSHGPVSRRALLLGMTSVLSEMVDDLVSVHRRDQRGARGSSRLGPYSIARFVADLEVLRKSLGL
jgi:proline iminopeptidase